MFCYECAESVQDGESYCRACGVLAANSTLFKQSWLSTVGHFALGILAFGLFTSIFIFIAIEFLKFTPFARYLVLALAGGISLGLAIHQYSRNRRVAAEPRLKAEKDKRSSFELLSEPAAVSFISISESLAIPTTSKLKVPRGN